MSNGVIVSIAGHGANLVLTIYGYENVNALNISDANWLTCHLDAKIGLFTGNVQFALTTSDISVFLSQLKQVDASNVGKAELTTDEGAIQCSVAMSAVGTALIIGKIQSSDSVEVQVVFSFDSDHSYLSKTIAELEVAVDTFPIRR